MLAIVTECITIIMRFTHIGLFKHNLKHNNTVMKRSRCNDGNLDYMFHLLGTTILYCNRLYYCPFTNTPIKFIGWMEQFLYYMIIYIYIINMYRLSIKIHTNYNISFYRYYYL